MDKPSVGMVCRGDLVIPHSEFPWMVRVANNSRRTWSAGLVPRLAKP